MYYTTEAGVFGGKTYMTLTLYSPYPLPSLPSSHIYGTRRAAGFPTAQYLMCHVYKPPTPAVYVHTKGRIAVYIGRSQIPFPHFSIPLNPISYPDPASHKLDDFSDQELQMNILFIHLNVLTTHLLFLQALK